MGHLPRIPYTPINKWMSSGMLRFLQRSKSYLLLQTHISLRSPSEAAHHFHTHSQRWHNSTLKQGCRSLSSPSSNCLAPRDTSSISPLSLLMHILQHSPSCRAARSHSQSLLNTSCPAALQKQPINPTITYYDERWHGPTLDQCCGGLCRLPAAPGEADAVIKQVLTVLKVQYRPPFWASIDTAVA